MLLPLLGRLANLALLPLVLLHARGPLADAALALLVAEDLREVRLLPRHGHPRMDLPVQLPPDVTVSG